MTTGMKCRLMVHGYELSHPALDNFQVPWCTWRDFTPEIRMVDCRKEQNERKVMRTAHGEWGPQCPAKFGVAALNEFKRGKPGPCGDATNSRRRAIAKQSFSLLDRRIHRYLPQARD
jgi:hypothetical protein